MKSPYVYLGGTLHLQCRGQSAGDRAVVTISTNNGRSFAPLYAAQTDGPTEAKVELKEKILRRYDYCLRIELTGGMRLTGFEVENDIQHAPRTLPWLTKGANTITVAADDATDLATRTVNGRITSDTSFNKNETSTSMGLTFDNLEVRDGSCWWKGGVGVMTLPVALPGDLVALRLSAQIRAGAEGHDPDRGQHRRRHVLARAREDGRPDPRPHPRLPLRRLAGRHPRGRAQVHLHRQ